MGQQLLNLPGDVRLMGLAHGIKDDFDHFVSADTWTTVATDSGTVAVGDGAGGIVTLTASDGSVADNDETYLKSTKEIFKIAANKALSAETRVQFTEANTDDANILGIGIMDAIAANSLLDDGGGPPASYSGACIYKVDGETLWRCESSNGATQKTTYLDADGSLDGVAKTAGGASYQTLKIDIIPTGDGLCDIQFSIDGVLVAVHKNRSYSSATEMNFGFGVKNGGANNQTLLVDYAWCYQTR